MNKIIMALIAVVLAFLVYTMFFKSPSRIAGEMAEDFEAELIDGTPFKLSELRGSYVVLDFWGSWCGPCRQDNPKLVALYNKYKDTDFDDAKGLKVVTVALEKNDRSWKSAAQKDGFVWPHQIVQTARFVIASPIAQAYNVSNLPTKFLIGPDGNILSSNMSFDYMDRYLVDHVK